MLLTSPWPESIYAFAPMWATLAEHARLFAVDLPGFGASERRTDLLSPRTMGDFLARLIAEAELGRPHIVAPDVGTAAALFAAAAHPERIASLIVGTGGAAVPLQLGEPLRSWVLDPDLDKYRRHGPARVRQHGDGHRRGRDTGRRSVPTTSPPTRATASSNRCATSAAIPSNCPRSPSSCRRSQRRSRSSTAGTTASCRSRTPSSSTERLPRTAASRSSTPATSSGKRRRRSTPRSSSTRSRGDSS